MILAKVRFFPQEARKSCIEHILTCECLALMKQFGTEHEDDKCISEHLFLHKALHRLHFFLFQTESLAIHYRLECFLMRKHKRSPWKLGFKPFWMRRPSQGVPWWARLSLCSMQTDRKASWGMGYLMSIKFFHVNYQIISCQSKSLSTPFLRHSPNRP